MPVTEQQISSLKDAIAAKLTAFGHRYNFTTEMRTASTSKHVVVQTAIDGYWETAAILDLGTGQFVKGTYSPHRRALKIHTKQPKTAPTIDRYELDGFGNVKGASGRRTVVLGATHQPGGEIRHANP